MVNPSLVNRYAKEEKEAELCVQCGQPADNGEGYNGLCGSCADRLENSILRPIETGEKQVNHLRIISDVMFRA